MLYIKKGRIYTRSFSFQLPEDMAIVTDPENIHPDTLTMETSDGGFILELAADTSDKTPHEQIAAIRNYEELVFMSENLPVQRGGMKGLGVYYHSEMWRHEYYEEYLTFPMNEDGQNILALCIQHEVSDEKDRNNIPDFIQRPNIQEFLDSIVYEPEVCDNIIR